MSGWGANSSGQLGDGFTVPSLTRRAVWGRSEAVLLAVGGSLGQYSWTCSYSQEADVHVIYDAAGYHPSPGAFT